MKYLLILDILENTENHNEENQNHNPENTTLNVTVYVLLYSVIIYGAI